MSSKEFSGGTSFASYDETLAVVDEQPKAKSCSL